MSPALECVRPPGMVGSAGREGRRRGRWRRGTARLISTSSLTEPTMGSAVRVSPAAPLHDNDITIMVILDTETEAEVLLISRYNPPQTRPVRPAKRRVGSPTTGLWRSGPTSPAVTRQTILYRWSISGWLYYKGIMCFSCYN